MPNTGTADLVTDLAAPPDVTQSYFVRKLLMNAQIYNYYERWADDVDLPQGEGRNVIVRRYAHLPLAGQLAQGVPPTGRVPTLDDFTVALVQHGDYVALTDIARWTQKDPIVNKFTELVGLQIGYTVDTYIRNIITNGTNVLFSNGTARTQVVTIIDGNDLDRTIRVLMRNGAEMYLGGNDGTSAANTYPVMPAYPCIIHPNTMFTLQNIAGFKDASQYRGAAKGEYGRYKSLAFFVATDPSSLGIGGRVDTGSGGASTAVANTGGTVDIYSTLAVGKHGYHMVKLNGKSTSFHAKPLGSAGTADPLDQLSTIGAKHTGAGLITNQNWLARLEHAVEN